MDKEKDTIIIEFTEDNLNEFLSEYYKTHRKGKKPIIESPMARSLNKMLVITNRIVQNTHKQNMKAYTCFVVKKLGLENLGISSANLNIHFVFPTKIRHDLDNFLGGCKEQIDGFSESGLIVDDDYSHIHTISSSAEYIKGETKMIFTFSNCKFDLDELKEVQAKEKIKKEKREISMSEKKTKKKSTSKKTK